MKHKALIRGMCICLLLASAIALVTACAKKDGPVRAMATFVIGTVTVERADLPARPLKHKEEVMRGDVVRTGADSMLVIQIGRDSIINIESNTTVSMETIMSRDGTRLNLDRGQVFSRLRHLKKGTDFSIITKTAIAAVRGTEFSVSYGKNKSVVAVNDGTVEVKKAAAGKEAGEGTAVAVGKAAVVDGTITTRPVSDAEKNDFTRFRKIVPIEDLDGTTESDLKRMEDDFMKNQESGRDIDKQHDAMDNSSVTRDKPVVNDEAKNVILWTGKRVYSSAETVIVYYKNMPDYRNCWIDVSKASDGDGRYHSYNWTYSAKNGRMTFSGLNLEPGLYEVRAHFGKSNSVDKRFRFRVQ